MVSSLNKRPHGLNKIAGAEIAIAGIHLIELQPLLLPIASYLALRSECVGAREIGIRPGPPMSWKGRGVRTPAGRSLIGAAGLNQSRYYGGAQPFRPFCLAFDFVGCDQELLKLQS
jgi:hypothetical protein